MKNKNILIEVLDLYELEKSQKRLIRDMYASKYNNLDKEIEDEIENIKIKKNKEIELLSEKIDKLKEELQKNIKSIKLKKIESFINDVTNFASIDLKIIKNNDNDTKSIDKENSKNEEESILGNNSSNQ